MVVPGLHEQFPVSYSPSETPGRHPRRVDRLGVDAAVFIVDRGPDQADLARAGPVSARTTGA